MQASHAKTTEPVPMELVRTRVDVCLDTEAQTVKAVSKIRCRIQCIMSERIAFHLCKVPMFTLILWKQLSFVNNHSTV